MKQTSVAYTYIVLQKRDIVGEDRMQRNLLVKIVKYV